MSFGNFRYVLHNVRWARVGPREGLLRRRRWQQRVREIGAADDIEVAAALLAHAAIYPDEVVYVYDKQKGGASVAAKYGWKYKK